jgi:hypothetical protein
LVRPFVFRHSGTSRLAAALALASAAALAACQRDLSEGETPRARAERVAGDTVASAWRHPVQVDSVAMRADTAIVTVSPRNWMATDAPMAVVRVSPAGKVIRIEWILGG